MWRREGRPASPGRSRPADGCGIGGVRRHQDGIAQAIPGCARKRQPAGANGVSNVDPRGRPRLGSRSSARRLTPCHSATSAPGAHPGPRGRAGGPAAGSRPPTSPCIVLNWNKRDETLACLDEPGRAPTSGGATVWWSTTAPRRLGRRDPGALPGGADRGAGARTAATPAATTPASAPRSTPGRARSCCSTTTPRSARGLPPAAARRAERRSARRGGLERHHAHRLAGGARQRPSSTSTSDYGIVRRRGVNALPGEGFDQRAPRRRGDRLQPADRAPTRSRASGCSTRPTSPTTRRSTGASAPARRASYLYYQPFSRVWHHGSKSTDVARPRSRAARRPRGALPNPIPLSWNPVRTYLGARNSVRFIRRHAGPLRTLYFVGSTPYNVPLELLAVVLDREEELKLGPAHVSQRPGALLPGGGRRSRETAGRRPREALRALLALAASRSCATCRATSARRARRAARRRWSSCVRGHWDGVRDRPLPLERLGLR